MPVGRLAFPLSCALCLLAVTFAPTPVQAQECKDDAIVTGYRVRSIRLEALWSRTPPELKEQLAQHVGEVYSSDKGSEYVAEIRKFLGERPSVIENALFGVNKLNKLSISVKLFTWCLIPVPEPDCQAQFKNDPAAPVKNCIDVVVKTKAIQLDVVNTSANVLPIPRTNRLIFFRNLPAPFTILNPNFTLDHDRRSGTSANFGISTNLLDFSQRLGSDSARKAEGEIDRNTQLQLALRGGKSIDESFYDAEARLSLLYARPLKLFDNLGLEASFVARERPHGEGVLLKNVLKAGGSFSLRPLQGPISRVTIGGKYKRSSNRFFSPDGSLSERVKEDAYEGRLIADGHIRKGFARLAIWLEGGAPKRLADSYQRLAAMVGYEKEIPVALNQTIGIEFLAGAGKSWGVVPEYARFYGGSTAGNFLYDTVEAQTLTNFPAGPLLRSFGQQQAGIRTAEGFLRGGKSYWHTNLNISIPIGVWSRPLIPAEQVAGTSTLKDVLKAQVSHGKVFYMKAVARQKLSSEQQQALRLDENKPLTAEQREQLKKAREAYDAAQLAISPEADKIWNEITPITNFVADYANIYSIKPLVMFDAGQIKAPGDFHNRIRYAIGGGLQLTVVIARFELGYMHTLNHRPGDNRGNVVARLVFQNLF